jgi:hypothetical protein
MHLTFYCSTKNNYLQVNLREIIFHDTHFCPFSHKEGNNSETTKRKLIKMKRVRSPSTIFQPYRGGQFS